MFRFRRAFKAGCPHSTGRHRPPPRSSAPYPQLAPASCRSLPPVSAPACACTRVHRRIGCWSMDKRAESASHRQRSQRHDRTRSPGRERAEGRRKGTPRRAHSQRLCGSGPRREPPPGPPGRPHGGKTRPQARTEHPRGRRAPRDPPLTPAEEQCIPGGRTVRPPGRGSGLPRRPLKP